MGWEMGYLWDDDESIMRKAENEKEMSVTCDVIRRKDHTVPASYIIDHLIESSPLLLGES